LAPGVDWSRSVGTHRAQVVSAVSGQRAFVPVDLLAGGLGSFRVRFDGWVDPNPDPIVIAITSGDLGFVAAGVRIGKGNALVLSGRVTTDDFGQPLRIDGAYSILPASGKALDTGILAILFE
jgi:hypothetical protein